MICRRCRREFDSSKPRCPSCGTSNFAVGGVFQTSIVRISTGRADRVYRSLEEVPAPLRTRLHRSTSGGNSATIVIADRRGREEIAKSLHASLGVAGGKAQATGGSRGWVTPRIRKIALAVILTLLATLTVLACLMARN